MQDPAGRKSPSTAVNRSTVGSDEELKRTLERDTAVQGESRDESAAGTRHPETGSASPTGRPPAGPRSSKTK